jgi:alpha/beta superfamily hydrolase
MASAVLLHPHPDQGGNQDNNVVAALYEALGAAGVTPHRFTFASSDPDTARAQTVAAIDAAEAPVFLVGYSFGGGIAATMAHPALAGWCLLAPALTLIAPTIGADPRPKFVLGAQDDAWFGPDVLRAATDGWLDVTHAVLPGADHFFTGHAADQAADLVLCSIAGALAA